MTKGGRFVFKKFGVAKFGVASLVPFLGLTGLLSACAGKGGESAKSGGDGDAAAVNEPAELIVYSNSGDTPESFDERFGNAIRKKFPQYTITYLQKKQGQGLAELVAQGTPIDLYWESVGQFMTGIMQFELQYDMTDLIKKHNIDLNRLEPTTVDAMRQMSGGKMYGIPVINNNLSLFYNKDIFNKFGVPYPKDGMTWDEVLDLNRKLTRVDGGKQYVGLGMSYVHFLRMNPFSLPYVDPKTLKATINTDPRWKTLYEYGVVNLTSDQGFRERIAGKGLPQGETVLTKDQDLAMYLFQSSYFYTRDLSGINWDMVSFPTFKEAPGVGSQAYPTYFSVTRTAKYKDQAMNVIKFLISDEFQMEISRKGLMTILKDEKIRQAFGQDGPYKDKNLKAVFYNKFAPISPKTLYDADAEKAYRDPITDLALGNTDLNTAFRKIEEAANKAIAEKMQQ